MAAEQIREGCQSPMTGHMDDPWAWHVHHNMLFERLTAPIEDRVAYIRKFKPKEEIEIRLRLLHLVKDQEVLTKYDDAVRYAWHTEVDSWGMEQWEAYEIKMAHLREAVKRLHALECPDCTWNGETIFPTKS